MLAFTVRVLAILAWMLVALMCVLAVSKAAPHPLEDLAALRVEPEGAQCHDRPYRDYSSEYRSYESDIGPNGLENRIVRAQRGIYSPYDDVAYDSITQTDIEHIVAREQAHVSGLCRATKSARVAYVHDLGNLTLATPEVNRVEKGKLDFAQWRPVHNRCWMAAAVVANKRVWGLSVDPLEKSALANQLHLCKSFEMHRGQ